MEVYSPYEAVPLQDVIAGDLVQFELDKVPVLALTIKFGSGEQGFLALESAQVGRIVFPPTNTVFRFAEQVVVELPRSTRGWAGSRRPDGPLVVSILGADTYFEFDRGGHQVAVDVRTGMLHGLPYQPYYLHGWGIWSKMSKNPLLEVKPPA